MDAICGTTGAGPSFAVVSAALCVGLMRRPEPFEPHKFALRIVTLPMVALIASTVGLLLLHDPWLGAVVFTTAMAGSIAARRFGARGAIAGRTIALPLIAILVVPAPPVHAGTGAMLALLAGAVALTASAAATWAAIRLGIVRAGFAEHAPQRQARPSGGMHVTTRMALQMAAALGGAFACGLLAFPRHWPWVVLSAFVVCSGALGRADALYKALLRLGGALGAASLASLMVHVTIRDPLANAVVIFTVLFIGIWLREINYAFWAACATLIFALLQGPHGADPRALLLDRIVCIAIGALCGVAAVWIVFPLQTRRIVRRRIADALAAMRATLAGENGHDLHVHKMQLRRLAPPMRLHRAFFARTNSDLHAATMLERALALLEYFDAATFDRREAGASLRRLGSMLRDSAGVSDHSEN